jgi:formylglycine-generating enzyme required for sulfatase activity
VVFGCPDPVVAILIEKQPDQPGQPDAFYIMRDKVWVGLFHLFARENPGLVQASQWNKGGDPRWPALGVTGPGAQAFAEWLGGPHQGFLPTAEQWDQAAGMNRKDRRLGPFQGTDDPKKGTAIAVGLEAPRPVGSAEKDISPYGCRDMSGNGWEWTRLPPGETDVVLRAESYTATAPFKFEKIKGDFAAFAGFRESNKEAGFRVVIELEPMP